MKTLIALFAASLLSAAAMAGDNKPGDTKADPTMKSTQATFDSLDKNADQQISKTEASADKTLSSSFVALDTNGDGYVSKSEFAARTKS
jgi:EF hand